MTENLEKRVHDYSLRVSEILCPNVILGRKGNVPDTVIFASIDDKNFHERFLDGAFGKAPHYVILRDGTVLNYISVTDSSSYFTTSPLSDNENYFAKAKGLVSFRPVNVALYSVSVLVEGSDVNDEQLLAAAALLRLISMKFIRVYRKKLPPDVNHIIPATALSSKYSFGAKIEDILELFKKKPI
ncbi:MAG: hypothetical protein E7477_01540 [Ruminococcaceae bacterium]|nr:hypothetical protein [Oscillospiraceae bacterium]